RISAVEDHAGEERERTQRRQSEPRSVLDGHKEMIRAVLADTGPLYATVDPDDEHHARALLELQKLNRDRQEIVILYSTLLEAYSLIMFRLGRDVASNWLLDMAQTALLNPTSEDYWQAAARIRALTDQSITLL